MIIVYLSQLYNHIHSIESPHFLLLEEGDEEDDGENEAQGAHNDVANCEEVVLAAQGISGREDKALVSIEAIHIVVIRNRQRVIAGLEVGLDLSPKFAEVGQTSCSHPYDEVLYNKNA